jgi:predicted hotdog family 3-hydroxylacyl-ACP dehydratase
MNPAPESAPRTDPPAGAPVWVTAELIAQTIRVWQPYYRLPLNPEDALAMILDVCRLVRVVAQGSPP